MRAILMVRCYKQNGHKAWVVLRDVGNNYDILMAVIPEDASEPKLKLNGKVITTLVEALVDFKVRCNFYVEQGWTTDTLYQKFIDGLLGLTL